MADPEYELLVPPGEGDIRLDQFLFRKLSGFSRGKCRKLIENGSVFLNRKRVKINSRKIHSGDRIVIFSTESASVSKRTSKIQIIYQDEWIAVVNKPPGIPSDQTRHGSYNTIVEIVKRQLEPLKYLEAVHRLDKPTSGVMILSKKRMITKKLMEEFRERRISKQYLAVVHGAPQTQKGKLENDLVRSKKDPRKMLVAQGPGKRAACLFQVVHSDEATGNTLLKVKLLTGRKHQIRVQFAFCGLPILGDTLYGGKKNHRLMLHSLSIRFKHPFSGESMLVRTDIPSEFIPPGLPKPELEKKLFG